MSNYIFRRLLQAFFLLFVLSIVMFALVNLVPGGPLAGHGQSRHIRPERIATLKRQFGLDKSLPEQYLIWLAGNDWMKVDADGDGVEESSGTRRGVLRGDFGFTFRTRQPVLNEIALRLPNTVYLMSITLLVALVLAIPAGVISAVRQYSKFDLTVTTFSFAGQAMPEVRWHGHGSGNFWALALLGIGSQSGGSRRKRTGAVQGAGSGTDVPDERGQH